MLLDSMIVLVFPTDFVRFSSLSASSFVSLLFETAPPVPRLVSVKRREG